MFKGQTFILFNLQKLWLILTPVIHEFLLNIKYATWRKQRRILVKTGIFRDKTMTKPNDGKHITASKKFKLLVKEGVSTFFFMASRFF